MLLMKVHALYGLSKIVEQDQFHVTIKEDLQDPES